MLLVVELKIPNHFQHLNATWKSWSWKAGIGLVAVERLCSTGRIRAFLLNASAVGHSYKTVTITSQLRRTCKALCQRARVETKKGLRGLVVSTGVYMDWLDAGDGRLRLHVRKDHFCCFQHLLSNTTCFSRELRPTEKGQQCPGKTPGSIFQPYARAAGSEAWKKWHTVIILNTTTDIE